MEENSEAKDLIKKISFIMYGNENEIFNIDKKAWRGVFNILGENDLTSGIYDKIISEYEDLSIDAIENEAKEYFDSISKESIYISVTDDIVGFSSLIKSVIDIENDGITIKSISDLVKRSLPLINPPEYIDYYPYFDYERFENFILETLREETEEIEDEYEENGKFLKKYREIIERDLKYWGFKNGKFENELFKVEVKSNPFEKIIKENQRWMILQFTQLS